MTTILIFCLILFGGPFLFTVGLIIADGASRVQVYVTSLLGIATAVSGYMLL